MGPLSIGLPEPLKTRPSISSETGVLKMSPVNSHTVFFASIPEVPSKTWNKIYQVTFNTQKAYYNLIYLNYSFASTNFQHLSRSDSTIMETQVHNFGILWKFHIIQDDQWTIYTRDSPVCCNLKEYFKTGSFNSLQPSLVKLSP